MTDIATFASTYSKHIAHLRTRLHDFNALSLCFGTAYNFKEYKQANMNFRNNIGILNKYINPLNSIIKLLDNVYSTAAGHAIAFIDTKNLHEHFNNAFVSVNHEQIRNYMINNSIVFIDFSIITTSAIKILYESAKSHPGNCHYYIKITSEIIEPRHDNMASETLLNFELYNLVTLFLTREEFSMFTTLLLVPFNFYMAFAEKWQILTCFNYYLTGPICVGKTSALTYFNTFHIINEWIDKMPTELNIESSHLTRKLRKKIDYWIDGQISKKHSQICDTTCGIQIIDRTLLDPLYFSNKSGLEQRAQYLFNAFYPTGRGNKVTCGQIILLDANIIDIANRAIKRGLKISSDFIRYHNETIHRLWSTYESKVKIIDTSDCTQHDIIKEISKTILLNNYMPITLDDVLLSFIGSKE